MVSPGVISTAQSTIALRAKQRRQPIQTTDLANEIPRFKVDKVEKISQFFLVSVRTFCN